MNRSLQRRLTQMLALSIFGVGVIAVALSLWMSFEDAQEQQDDNLRSIALLVRPTDLASGQYSVEAVDNDPSDIVVVTALDARSASQAKLPLPKDLADGPHSLLINNLLWRVYVHRTPTAAVAAAQPDNARLESAIMGGLAALLPLLVLTPLLAVIAAWTVRSQFAPVRTLSAMADAGKLDEEHLLPETEVPEELAPFVGSINQLLLRQQSLLAQQRRFIADAAHELRSPLAALSLQAQNVARAGTMENVQARLVPLSAGIARAHRLTEQLLDLARQQQTSQAGQQDVDVLAVAREVIAELLPQAEAKATDLGLEAGAPLNMKGDRLALRLLLRNAVDNAIRYSPAGSEVTVKVFSENGLAALDVIDNGPGIPEADRENLFAAFTRLAGSGQSGSGLGLAIAGDAAARLGGRIGFHDRADGQAGVVFSFRKGLS